MEGKSAVIDISADFSNEDGNNDKQLDESTKEVYQITFDLHEDGETFYNACGLTFVMTLEKKMIQMHQQIRSRNSRGKKKLRSRNRAMFP